MATVGVVTLLATEAKIRPPPPPLATQRSFEVCAGQGFVTGGTTVGFHGLAQSKIIAQI